MTRYIAILHVTGHSATSYVSIDVKHRKSMTSTQVDKLAWAMADAIALRTSDGPLVIDVLTSAELHLQAKLRGSEEADYIGSAKIVEKMPDEAFQ